MVKLVINDGYGGFGLSIKGVKRYAKLTGMKLYPFIDLRYDREISFEDAMKMEKKFKQVSFKEADKLLSEGKIPLVHYAKKPIKDGMYDNNSYFSSNNIKRDDPDLIRVVEELGGGRDGGASGSCASLKIIEIPNGVEWEIGEYDGNEHVAEKHQTWS